jgi:orotate phosphoribosyltransferase
VVDDWIPSGSSIRALAEAVGASGAEYLGASVLVDRAATTTVRDLRVAALVSFDELVDPG